MLYILAWLTDILDGALARYRKQFSIWGCRIDPITDKVLNDSIFIGYGWFWRNDPEFSVMFWTIVVIVVADLITLVGAGLMSYFIEERVQANIFGKWKFGAQCTGCTMLILEWVNSARPVLEVAAALGILSAVSYCYTGCVKIRARTGRS
jgi:phosphatidylglycerophosphate synthase